MNLLADMTSHVQAHLISTQRTDALGSERAQFLFSASFDEEDKKQGGCQWDFLFESMHIEFMQQEALRFEVQHLQSFFENTVEATQTRTSRRLFDDEDGDKNHKQEDHEQGDDESNDSYESILGDIRILDDSDSDDEDEDKSDKKAKSAKDKSDKESKSAKDTADK